MKISDGKTIDDDGHFVWFNEEVWDNHIFYNAMNKMSKKQLLF